MKPFLFVLVLTCFSGAPVFAQGVCDQRVDPHSFACDDAAFAGQVFPLVPLSLARVEGRWRLLTHSTVSGVMGPEFHMVRSSRNPRVPEGVLNRADRSFAGPLDWFPSGVRFHHWSRARLPLFELPGKTAERDSFTVETRLQGAGADEGLQCRIFLRNQTDHLLCRWFALREGRFFWRGYLGFLRSR